MNKLAKKLNEELKNTNEAQQYFALKKSLLSDEYINSLLDVINKTQKEMKECLKTNDVEGYKLKAKYLEVLKEEFTNHPLLNNYIVSKNELYNLLEQIVNILSE